jgi:hypothetical protein
LFSVLEAGETGAAVVVVSLAGAVGSVAGAGASLVFRDGALAGGGNAAAAASSFLVQAVQARAIRVRAISDFFMGFPFLDKRRWRAPKVATIGFALPVDKRDFMIQRIRKI